MALPGEDFRGGLDLPRDRFGQRVVEERGDVGRIHLDVELQADDALADAVLSAGRRTGEELWRLPLYEHVRGMLKSDIADLRNVGERGAGAIQGAMFLRDFAEDRPFLHLDIAGPAWLKKDHALGPKGGTGFGIRTLVDWLASWVV